MELLALDPNFAPVGYLVYINLQWNREYYSPGKFSVQIPAGAYAENMAYIYTPERPETGIIQKVELTENIKGRFVQLSGYFLENALNDKVVYPTYYAAGSSMAADVVRMLKEYKADIPLLEVEDAPQIVETNNSVWQETGGQLGTAAWKRLQGIECGLRCVYDYKQNKTFCGVWQGKDRTQGQTENPFVTFADGFGNLTAVDASSDNSNYKNYAIVAGQDQGENRKVAVADLSGGGYKKQIYFDSRNSRWDPEKQTEAEYMESLQQEGFEKLLDYQTINNVDIDASAGGYKYRQDWDLGDKVDVIVADAGISMEARIVTVREVHKENNTTITIELGNKKLTTLKKARLIH